MAPMFPPFELKQLKCSGESYEPELKRWTQGLYCWASCWKDPALSSSWTAAVLGPLKSLFVLDAASEDYFDGIRRKIDAEVDDGGIRIIHAAAADDSGCYDSLKDLLQLGADPDVLDLLGSTVSEICSTTGNGSAAEVIIKCRPDLSLVSIENRRDQLQYAMCLASQGPENGNAYAVGKVAEIWRKAMKKDGFPSLAQLAHNQDWYAVHNLCRRRVVREEEKNGPYKGKTALEWAQFHGQEKMAKELMYILQINLNDKVPEHVADEVRNREMEELKEMFLVTMSKTNEKNEEFEKEIAVLRSENDALKEAVKQLKDALIAAGGHEEKLAEGGTRSAQ